MGEPQMTQTLQGDYVQSISLCFIYQLLSIYCTYIDILSIGPEETRIKT